MTTPEALVMQRVRQAIEKQEWQTITCSAHWFRHGNLNVKCCYCCQRQRFFCPLQRAQWTEVARSVVQHLIASVRLHSYAVHIYTELWTECWFNVMDLVYSRCILA